MFHVIFLYFFVFCFFFFISCFFFQAEDGIRDLVRSRGLGDVYKRQDVESIFMNVDGGSANMQIRVQLTGGMTSLEASDIIRLLT